MVWVDGWFPSLLCVELVPELGTSKAGLVSSECHWESDLLMQARLTKTCCYVTSVMSNSVRPHRRQPTRLPHPWDSPGKNTVVGCHFLLQCVKVKNESEVAQSCPTLSDPMDCSPPDSSVHGIFQARVLEWGATWELPKCALMEE